MQDSNTPNPSEQPADKPPVTEPHPLDAGEHWPAPLAGKAPVEEEPKLKLRKVLTPISPHLKAPRPEIDPRFEVPHKPIEIPHAVPIDPEEDDMPPPPAIPAGHGANPEQPLPNPELVAAPLEPPPPDEEAQPGEAAVEEAGEEEPTPQVKPRAVSGKRIMRLLAPVFLVAGLLYLANMVFDPFGLRAEKIRPGSTPTATVQARKQAPKASLPHLTGMELRSVLSGQTLDDFLSGLERQKWFGSQNPDGIFIGAAFVPVGQAVDPRFNLVLKEMTGSEAVLVDGDLREYRMRLN